jgi:hypothetical protein
LVVIEMLAEVHTLAGDDQAVDPTGTIDLLVMQGGLEETEEPASSGSSGDLPAPMTSRHRPHLLEHAAILIIAS